ncbi:uncharacterized protein isoform X2 [Choristoneura fumiferana]|uniref:uncharacterized protein isoform X2 n=1 Tax=Choristoneura fumiferana TaxID=7141 RepID=UPI003D15B56E
MKPYSIREMKTIVDYLVEHKAYGEIRGRKMWMDFASTRLTNRTWQSLKEAFLKRILPDITNPYYRLDVDQIHSFKRGLDLTEKHKRHLDFEPVGDKSNNNDAKGDNEQPSTSNNNEENATGEDTTCSKLVHNRASTETLILENCYETAKDIQADLERSTDEEEDDKKNNDKLKPQSKRSVKSIRDFIEYTEPLTPMLQEVLHDFATDDESDKMLIDEDFVPSERKSNSPEPAVLSQSILKSKVVADNSKTSNEGNEEKMNHDNNNKEVPESNELPAKIIESQLTENNEEAAKNIEASLTQFEDVMKLVDKALAKHLGSELDTQKDKSQEKVQNSNENSSAITDSLLPNNQEAINSETFPNASSVPAPQVNNDQNSDKPSKKRKRSNSAEIMEKNKTKRQKDTNNKNNSDAVEIIDTNETLKHTDVEQCLDSNKEINQNNVNDPKADSGPEKNNAESLKKKHNLTLNNGKSSNIGSRGQNKSAPNETVTHHISSDGSEIALNQSAQVENPCLKSVSLFAEQFSLKKYSDSDLEVVQEDGKKKTTEKNHEPKHQDTLVVEKANDVVLPKSRSNSESKNESPSHLTMKQRRDKIAKVFGLTNGGRAQSRRMNGRKRTTSHRSHQLYISSESSEWTSASDSEYVSPPRSRRYRYPRKHFKPHSGRVISLEECGGMYVMLGKKVYPLTKQGKTIQNYVRESFESDADEEDNYWKVKYIEEKKRTFELKKILQKSKQSKNDVQIVEEPESPIEVSPLAPVQRQQRQSLAKETVNGDELVTRKETEIPEKQGDDKTLKIKFTKKDEEIQLEGHWQHINPLLAQVVSMFHKEHAIKQAEPANFVELSSGTTTPRPLTADTGVQEKINKIESDIFNEIVEQHKEEVQPTPKEDIQDSPSKTSVENDTNVTVRKKRGRPFKSSLTAVASSPSKNAERSAELETKSSNEEKDQQGISEIPAALEKRTTRTPKKLLEVASNAATKQVRRRKSSAKEVENNDEEFLYKFPSPPPTKRGKKSTTNVTNNAIETASNHSKPRIASPDDLSNKSLNSNQGYQDSDASPFNIGLRKKRRFSVSTMSLKGRKCYRKNRSKSLPNLIDYETSESSNSSFSISVKSVTQSTINSEVHRSESYQLLMPRKNKTMHTLEKIEEAANERNVRNVTHRMMSNLSVEIEISEDPVRTASNDVASSSNISFPPSPELSIVENISISKSMVIANDDYPTINEMQSQLTAMNPNNKFLMSAVDVSMPLMAQECSLQKHLINVLNDVSDLRHAGRFLSTPDLSAPKMSSMTESILNEIRSVSNEGTLSDSLDRRLEQLLLESAQKPTATKYQDLMEVDTEVKKNPRSRKRSSTPNKKKTLQRKTKIPEISLVEEECKERCTRNGRRSCPPSINIVYHEGDVPDNLQIDIHEETTPDVTSLTKRKNVKKDIIKVKILKPKKKPEKKRKSPKIRTSGNIECDNESGVFLQDTSDLIHNHSELCLFNKDCTRDRRRDSVEFIETTAQSIITLNSSTSPEASKENIDVNIVIAEGDVTPETFSDNAQFAANFVEAKVSEAVRPESDNTQYFTPLSPHSSIITEDLSDETPDVQPSKPRPTKWYLLSEEDTTETTSTNYFDSYQNQTSDVRSYGANLQQLFPITCAVPDLSTITEMSEKSPKPWSGNRGDTDFDSQSIN